MTARRPVRLTRRGEHLLYTVVGVGAFTFGWFSVPLGIFWVAR